MTQTVDSTISTGFGSATAAPSRNTRRLGRRSIWALTGLAAIAVSVGVGVTRADNTPASSTTSAVAGQPATTADLQIADEWAQRLDAMATGGLATAGRPATAADLQIADEWAQRLDAMATGGLATAARPATAADLRLADEWARRLDASSAAGPATNATAGRGATTSDIRYASEWAHRLEAMAASGSLR